VLDALINEAQIRWGLDLTQGLAVVPAEWLVATPIEPSRPAIVVPLALLRPGVMAGGVAAAGAAEAVADRAPTASADSSGVPAASGSSAAASSAASGSSAAAASRAAAGSSAVVATQAVPGRHGPRGRTALDVLRRLYPADHPVGRFGAVEGTTVGALTDADLGMRLYLGPVPADVRQASPWSLPWLSARLRAPDGCPWDREQTHESLRRHLLEEAYEVYDILGEEPTPALAGELGDLLLQIVLHAQLASEEGVFDLTDVYDAIGS
jgi:NTP pyrophosphatase (non-canonical NTP hydrolase)